jgi:hypothetical protein
MTNREHWHNYCSELFTNRALVEWGWHMLIGAALERRVYFDNLDHPQYPNMYTVFIAPAGVGKGLVLDEIKSVLTFHKSSLQVQTANSATQLLQKYKQGNAHIKDTGERGLFKLAADSTTFESLLVEMVGASILQGVTDMHTGEKVDYVHASLTFVLDEFTSIFKQHAEDLLTFLLTAWNCKDYNRKTKNMGHDDLTKICLNIAGGTTPSEFLKLIKREVIGTGLMGRVAMVYAQCNDKRGIKIPALTPDQVASRDVVRAWALRLKSVYGCVKLAPEVQPFLESWYDSSDFIVNTSSRLDEYYARKINHLIKLSMAHHFGEPGYEGPISLTTVKYVINMMAANEQNMHLAFTIGGRNELASIQRAVVQYMKRQPAGVTINDLMIQFVVDTTLEEMQTILHTAQLSGLINTKNEMVGTHQITKYYAL